MVGNRSLAQVRRILTLRGTLVLVGGEGGDRWTGGVGRSMRALVVTQFVRQRLRMILATANTADLLFLKEFIEAGMVTPVIDWTYSLNETADAIRYLKEGNARGKIIIAVRDPVGRPAYRRSVRTESLRATA